MSNISESSDSLDGALHEMMVWKPGIIRNAAIKIVQHALELGPHGSGFWPDEIDMDDVLLVDKNAIGAAYRQLIRFDVIGKTGTFRRSKSTAASSRTIFCYRIESMAQALLFLKANQPTVERPIQNELNLP